MSSEKPRKPGVPAVKPEAPPICELVWPEAPNPVELDAVPRSMVVPIPSCRMAAVFPVPVRTGCQVAVGA